MIEFMKSVALVLAIARDALIICVLVVALVVFGQVKGVGSDTSAADCPETARYYGRC